MFFLHLRPLQHFKQCLLEEPGLFKESESEGYEWTTRWEFPATCPLVLLCQRACTWLSTCDQIPFQCMFRTQMCTQMWEFVLHGNVLLAGKPQGSESWPWKKEAQVQSKRRGQAWPLDIMQVGGGPSISLFLTRNITEELGSLSWHRYGWMGFSSWGKGAAGLDGMSFASRNEWVFNWKNAFISLHTCGFEVIFM